MEADRFIGGWGNGVTENCPDGPYTPFPNPWIPNVYADPFTSPPIRMFEVMLVYVFPLLFSV